MNFNLGNYDEIKGGLSKKKIYRKNENKISKIIIDFSGDEKDFENFLIIYKLLRTVNISIPKIYEIHKKDKLIFMEDFGEKRFDKEFYKKDLYTLLKIGIDSLITIQNSLTFDDISMLEQYTFENLKSELSEFVDYYIPYNNINNFPVDAFFEIWKDVYHNQNFDFNGFVLKDFEFINLFFLEENRAHLKCGIIDFQSAFLGFVGWDLFSLLENSRINFSRKYNEELINYYYKNVNIKVDYKVFRTQYYLLNLSRQTRLLGRWANLSGMKNEKEYFNYIETTKSRIISCLDNINNQNLKSIYYTVFKDE